MERPPKVIRAWICASASRNSVRSSSASVSCERGGSVAEIALQDGVESVAIIGMVGRFPGARDVEEFWANLVAGVESISRFDDAELLASGVDPAILAQPNYVKARAVLEDVDLFDAAFFGYTPREAELMDPQHRL